MGKSMENPWDLEKTGHRPAEICGDGGSPFVDPKFTHHPAKRGESDEHRISNDLQLGRCFASSQQAVQPIEGVQMSQNVNTLVNGLV